MRFVDPARRFAVGVHTSPFEPYPTKLWALGTYADALSVGVQVSAPAAASLLLGARSGLGVDARLPTPAPPPLSVDAAVSLAAEAPAYELSLALDGSRRELVAGYVHSMTLRRASANPLGPRHVRGVYNYVDLGFELRRSLLAPHASALCVGASAQLNRHVLLKARVGTSDAAASLALRGWWDPAATLVLSATTNRATGATALGAALSIYKGGAPEYRRAAAGEQVPAPSMSLRAQPHLSAATSQRLEREVWAPPGQALATKPTIGRFL